MKRFELYLPGGLLLAYAIYTTFIPATIAHSIIIIALASLTGYSQFLLQRQQPSTEERLEKYKSDIAEQLKLQKEAYDSRLSTLESELGKAAIVLAQRPGSPSTTPPRKDKVFF